MLFRDQQPQNPCANFNGDCTHDGDPLVDDFDYQILNCLIIERSVLVNPALPWNPETNPRVYGACNTNIDPTQPSNCGQTLRSCLVAAVPSDADRRGCGNPVCCQKVCEVSPFCCDVIWDTGCTNIAQNICYPNEPDTQPDAGNCLCVHAYDLPSADCLAVHTIPGCSDSKCADLVCACDPACCIDTWDLSCVDAAQTFCSQPCTTLVLQEYVCEVIPECCTSGTWDAACTATAALTIVQKPNGLLIPAFPRNCLLCPADDDFVQACSTAEFKNLMCLIDDGNPPSTDYSDPIVYDKDNTESIQTIETT